jgi:O-antigen ligase
MRFALFLLVNALLFVRPGDMIPELADAQLYQYAIVLCLLVSLPAVLNLFSRLSPVVRPILLCVLGLVPAAFLSNLFQSQVDQAVDNGVEYVKMVVYFLLLVTLVDTPARLRQLLAWIAVFTAVLTLVSFVNYYTASDEAAALMVTTSEMKDGKEREGRQYGQVLQDVMIDPDTGELLQLKRLCGVGLFKDPNDLGLALVIGLLIALFLVTRPEQGTLRLLWLGLIGLFGTGLALTHSRGGFVALLGGLAAFFYTRFGLGKSLLLGALVLPVLLAVFAGRMTDISTSANTGQSRLALWAEGLAMLRESPLFGIGMENYRERVNYVAHNSYLHAYAELGVFGGTMFFGAFYLATMLLFRWRQQVRAGVMQVSAAGPELERLFPLAFAVLTAYMAGIFFLSRVYVVPTYTILGMAAAYLAMAEGWAQPVRPRCGPRPLVHLAGASMGFLGGFYILMRVVPH